MLAEIGVNISNSYRLHTLCYQNASEWMRISYDYALNLKHVAVALTYSILYDFLYLAYPLASRKITLKLKMYVTCPERGITFKLKDLWPRCLRYWFVVLTLAFHIIRSSTCFDNFLMLLFVAVSPPAWPWLQSWCCIRCGRENCSTTVHCLVGMTDLLGTDYAPCVLLVLWGLI